MKIEKLLDAESRANFQARVLRDLELAEVLFQDGKRSEARRCVGVEQELQFVGPDGRPADVGDQLSAAFPSPIFQKELSSFTFELALPPVEVGPGFLQDVDEQLAKGLERIAAEAALHRARPVLCGILPSLRLDDIGPDALTAGDRYELLHELRDEAKRSGFEYQIRGIDELVLAQSNGLLLDGVFTSLQLHWQVHPATAAEEYNWSQLITAPCLAAACCSPLFLGKRLWHETRISLFRQSSDLRQRRSGPSGDSEPRATLGHGWIDDIVDVWKDELTAHTPFMGLQVEEDPQDEWQDGRVPKLNHLQFFNGTVYRWNRLCYGVGGDENPTFRIEARALPAGLTRRDQLANAALWWGLMSAATEEGHDLPEKLPFSRVRESFNRAARDGMESQIFWKDGKLHPVDRLLLDELIPIAERELQRLGVADAAYWLEPVEERARSQQTASRWLLDSFEALRADYDPDRSSVYLTEAMISLARSNEPVSRWPKRAVVQPPSEAAPLRTTDSIELALHRLVWENRGRLPVGDGGPLLDHQALVSAQRDGCVTVDSALDHSRGRPSPTIDCFGRTIPLRREFARIKGEEAGPLLVIVAGLHGNESNGVAAMAEFLEAAAPKKGELVGLLGNLSALEQDMRYLDHDLNRTFAEDGWSDETPEGREAGFLWSALSELAEEADGRDLWLVDLHGTSGHTPPYLSALSDRAAWPVLDELPVPKATGFEAMIPNTLVEYAARRGWKAGTFEIGSLAAPVSVSNGVGILQLLSDALDIMPIGSEERQRITDGLTAQSPTMAVYDFVYRHAIGPDDRFEMLPGFVSFQPLRRGEQVGSDRNGPVLSPCEGRILMPLYQAQGESGFYVVSERSEP